MIIVFDLDDTLYEEINYVKSGFKAVANYLAKQYSLNSEKIYTELYNILLEKGRGNIFDEVLNKYNILSKKEIKKCLSVYRTHKPDICLTKEAIDCINRFKNYSKYIVTDGNKLVQTIKINVLNLEKYFKKCIVTHNYGINKAKPSTYVFHKILEWEKAEPSDLVYIADNPNKDFVNLKKEGFKTIRILTGNYKDLRLPVMYEADYEVNTLDQLDEEFIKKISKK